ncbi:ABC transporter ATP-binding protein, partial [bacterium]|nr:ABC transporter ATP-binding protein [bacterium]
VAAHLEPEILIVDEVLAVGDASFQKKCLGKMENVAKGGRTILFVSHNMGAVRSLCGRAILLDQGQVVMEGESSSVISSYLSSGRSEVDSEGQVVWIDEAEAPGGDEIRFRAIRLIGPDGKSRSIFEVDKPIKIEIYYTVKKSLRGMRINLRLLTLQGEIAFQTTDHNVRAETVQFGKYKSICIIPGELLNIGKYSVKVGSDIPNVKVLHPGTEYLCFSTVGTTSGGSNFPEDWPGIVCPKLDWQVIPLSAFQQM